MPHSLSCVSKHSVFFTTTHTDNCVHTHTRSFNDNRSNNSQVQTLLSTAEKWLFELSTPEHVHPQGVGENECSEMVIWGLQANSFNQVTADIGVKDAEGSLTNS